MNLLIVLLVVQHNKSSFVLIGLALKVNNFGSAMVTINTNLLISLPLHGFFFFLGSSPFYLHMVLLGLTASTLFHQIIYIFVYHLDDI